MNIKYKYCDRCGKDLRRNLTPDQVHERLLQGARVVWDMQK